MRYALYHRDSYAREIDAAVVAVDGERVALDDTVFYAQGGGQPFDQGTLAWDGGEARVVEVRSEGGRVWHRLEGGAPPEGAAVRGTLDWERRFALMRAHTALHILSGIIWRDLGAPVTGGGMEVGSARMDFELEAMSADFAERIQARLDEEVAADRPVEVRFLPRDEAFAIPDLIRTKVNLLPPGVDPVRVVEIVGLDVQADGGTHVARTGEVGSVRVVGHQSKGRGNKRLRIQIW